jgi:hypothetical protein
MTTKIPFKFPSKRLNFFRKCLAVTQLSFRTLPVILMINPTTMPKKAVQPTSWICAPSGFRSESAVRVFGVRCRRTIEKGKLLEANAKFISL